jgi:SPP1 family predicted phage head-tail adaptor
MRHRITIRRATVTQNAYGEPVETWADWKTVWGEITPLSGSEYFASAQTQAATSHRIRARYLDGITSKDEILFDGRTFTIDSIHNFGEQGKEMVIMASESV